MIAKRLSVARAAFIGLMALVPNIARCAPQPTPVTAYGSNGNGTFSPLPSGTSAAPITVTPSGSGTQPVSDPNNAPYSNAILITPGTSFTAGRSLGFVCTTAGNVTITLSSGTTITVPLLAIAAFQTLPFAATNVTLGSGTVATLWNLP